MADELATFSRIQSPSSINTYKQCPRKYFYQYKLKLPSLPSIHLLRGGIMHKALEEFFMLEVDLVDPERFEEILKIVLVDLFNKNWRLKNTELNNLRIGDKMLEFYYKESLEMVTNFSNGLFKKIRSRTDMKPADAFRLFKPETEVYYKSTTHGVQGYIDAIHKIDDETILMDYKTSKKAEIGPEYKLQLAIYALLYLEKHGELPKRVGINFLKFDEQFLNVDEELVDLAKKECKFIHDSTKSDQILDYPKNTSALCKWSTGQCDFYEVCVRDK